ncbi:hypothetical protein D3C81_1486890 [compost metagenome]
MLVHGQQHLLALADEYHHGRRNARIREHAAGGAGETAFAARALHGRGAHAAMAVRARPLGQLHGAAGQTQESVVDGIEQRAHAVPGQAGTRWQLFVGPDRLAIAALPQAHGLCAAQIDIERGRLGGRGQG